MKKHYKLAKEDHLYYRLIPIPIPIPPGAIISFPNFARYASNLT